MSAKAKPFLGRTGMARLLAAALSLLAPGLALAQTLSPGDAVVTRFSGGVVGVGGGLVIDTNGASAIGLSLANPGAPAAGGTTASFPELFRVAASDVGQVFGVAVRPGTPATIYFSATSAFGLHLQNGGPGWTPGQWGAGGGPGTIYRLVAVAGARPEVFATITLDGRPNTGASLGNITYDSVHNQLFVSDLETGMIHRLNADDGRELGRYDHGVEGRPAFLDLARLETGSRPAIAFDPASRARVADCPSDFDETPACWNIADFRRRVWGLGVFNDEVLGDSRLYYSVWSSQGFGNPEWDSDAQEQINAVWSVGLDASGAFDTSDVRLELDLPGFFVTVEDYQRAGGSHPVSDITFSGLGDMLLAERGGLRGLGLDADAPFAWPRESRVLVFRRDENRIWMPAGRYDVGFSDRQNEGQPFIRAGAAGGVALGFGYDAAGRLELENPEAFVWMTGDGLCAAEGPCFAPDGTQANVGPVSGAEGQPADDMAEVNPDAAFEPYPASGPATPPSGPEQAYIIDVVDSASGNPASPNARFSWVGSIAIAGALPEPPAPPQGEPDLQVTKSLPTYCIAGAQCTAQITITNVGSAPWDGPIYFNDIVSPPGPAFSTISAPAVCATIPGLIACYHPHTTLAPGEQRQLLMDIVVPIGMTSGTLENCAMVTWPLATPGNNSSVVRAVQLALTILGYNPGPVDGSMGPLTRTAIAMLQADLGITPTSTIDAQLLSILFARDAGRPGDANPANDRGCATTTLIPAPVPPVGIHLPTGSYPGHWFPASIHAPIGSGPGHAFPASVHLPAGSMPGHAFPWSVHLPIGSGPAHAFPWSVHLPIGSGPAHAFPLSVHLPAGSLPGHVFPWSIHLPAGSVPAHVFPWSIHLPVGSGPAHVFPLSIHVPAGSGPGHVFPTSVHLPAGSIPGHVFPWSMHLPAGSGPGHLFPWSVHLPVGSGGGHAFPWSVHLPAGSAPGHGAIVSVHWPVGSALGHLPLGSVHLPVGSALHLPFGSAGGGHLPLISAIGPHVPFVSAGGAHLPLLSAIGAGPHLPLASAAGGGHSPIASAVVHLPVGSAGGPHLPIGSAGPVAPVQPLHLPTLSGLHLPIGSGGAQHLPVGSSGNIHLPVGSGGSGASPPEPAEPSEPIHLPVGSVQVHRPAGSTPQPPAHQPPGSVQTHQPPGSVQHLPRGSVQQHLPPGSVQQHLPPGSVQEHQPPGSEQQHLPPGSVQQHFPRGSIQLHLPPGSVQEHQPPGSQQTHQPPGSQQTHLPPGSEQTHEPPATEQVHRPRGSVQTHQPIGSQPETETPSLRLQLPIHDPRLSRAQQQGPD